MATPEVLAEKRELAGINADYKEKFGFNDSEAGYAYKAPKGLTREIVETISDFKEEPQWMRDFRLKALEHFESRPTPKWGGDLDQIDFDDIHYFVRASEKNSRDWSEVPEDIKNTFDRLGIPEAERKFLAGVGGVGVGSRCRGSVDLQLDDVVLDHDREGVDRDIGGQGLRLAGPQIEERAVARALDRAGVGIEVPLGERTVVVRAAVLDGKQLAGAVEDADLELLPFHDAPGTGRELRERADFDDVGHGGQGLRVGRENPMQTV